MSFIDDAVGFVNPFSDDFLAIDQVAGDNWNPLSPVEQPPPPDFTGAAEATSAGNLELARQALEANRFDITSPLGNLEWARPDIEAGETTWTKNINLSPEAQSLFDKGLLMQGISADIGLTAGEQIKDIFSTPFQLDDFEGYREDVYDAMMSRLEEDIDRDWDTRNAELYAAGIGRGTEAYGWEQTQRDRMLNDARLQAYQRATDQALRERAQTVEEALLQRQTPLNEFNAWRTGAQVQLPTFENQANMATVAGPDYMNAAQQQAQYDLSGYNADVMKQNALMGGLFGLGAAGLMGPAGTLNPTGWFG